MEAFLAVAACLISAAASAQTALLLTDDRLGKGAGISTASLIRRACELAELLGHRVWAIRLANATSIAPFVDRLGEVLRERGLILTRFGCTAGLLLSVALSAIAGWSISGSVIGGPVAALLAVAAVHVLVRRSEESARMRAADQMPELFRSFAATLAAGRSLSQAVEHVGRNLGGPIGSEFLRASFEIAGGTPPERAIDDVCARVDAPGMDLLGTALGISRKTGSPLGDLFARTSRMVSDGASMRRELRVKTSQARLSARVVAAMPLLLAGILALISPDYRAGLLTPAGGTCVCMAILLDCVALFIIRSLVESAMR